MTRDVAVQKVIGLCCVVLAIWYFQPMQLVLLFSVLGQGHFLGAYYYQWKAGKMHLQWLATFITILAVLSALAILGIVTYQWFALVASVIFFIHHFQDEVALFGKERSAYRGIEIALPVIVFSALAADLLMGTSLMLVATIVVGLLAAVYAVAVATRHTPDVLSAYFLFIAAALLVVHWVLQVAIPPEVLIGSVILFHYACWYVHFYFRFAPKPERQRQYIVDMLVIHAIVFSAYALWMYSPWGAPFKYLFAPLYFYIWAILHILFSIRVADYRALSTW